MAKYEKMFEIDVFLWFIIGSDNGSEPTRSQAIMETNICEFTDTYMIHL